MVNLSPSLTREEFQKGLSELVEIICDRGDLPSSTKVVNTLLSIDPDDEYSVQDLAAIILQDYGLTHRVLRMANSCYFNPTGQEVTTVSRAIVLLGLKFIREMAITATLFDTLIKKVPPKSKERLGKLLSSSYMCAFLAHKLALHFKDHKPEVEEEWFICALFHHIGRILLLLYSPETLTQWERLEKERPELIQKRLYLLMERVMSCWALPKPLVETLEGSPKSKEPGSLAAFMSRLDKGVQEFLEKGQKGRLKSFFSEFGLTEKDLDQQLLGAKNSLEEFFPVVAKDLSKDLLIQTGSASQERTVSEGETQEEFLTKSIREITAALALQEVDYQKVLLMVMEAMMRFLRCEDVFLLVPRPDKRSLLIKYGLGQNIKRVEGREIPWDEFFKRLFAKAVEWSGPVENMSFPPNIKGLFLGRDLLISPLSLKGRGVAAFMALRSRPFSLEEKKKIEMLRHLALIALRQAFLFSRAE